MVDNITQPDEALEALVEPYSDPVPPVVPEPYPVVAPVPEPAPATVFDDVEAIRTYARDQLETWHKVQYLALQVEALGKKTRGHQLAFRWGQWPLEPSMRDGQYRVFVDLETGELVDPASNYQDPRLAADEEIAPFAQQLDHLDAKRIVSELEALVRGPKPERFEKDLEMLESDYSLSTPYFRR